MTDQSRDLIQRLADELEGEIEHKVGWGEPDYADELINEARAYLAALDEPAVPAGREPASVAYEPSDEEILALAQWHEIAYPLLNGVVIYPKQECCDMRDDVLSFARAVLARWGGR